MSVTLTLEFLWLVLKCYIHIDHMSSVQRCCVSLIMTKVMLRVLCYVATTSYVWWLRCLRDTWQRHNLGCCLRTHKVVAADLAVARPCLQLWSPSEGLSLSLLCSSLAVCAVSDIFCWNPPPPRHTSEAVASPPLLADINLRPRDRDTRADITFLCGCLIPALMYEWFLFNL